MQPSSKPRSTVFNALTIDVEDYFQVYGFSRVIRYEDWDRFECRIERNVNHLLEILNGSPRHSTLSTQPSPKGTFFILGWIAERYPQLVKRIQKEGYEIACHGYSHKLIYTQSREEFRQDVRKAKAILEDITGREVIGYRAPSFSITSKTLWALRIIAEEGFRYDSSIFPINHDFYGMPDAPRFPFLCSQNGNGHFKFELLHDLKERQKPTHDIAISQSSMGNGQSIKEFPLSTLRLGNFNLPVSGGGYFRLFPYTLIKKGLEGINKKDGKPFIFYLHPWELDPDQPKIDGLSLRSRIRHYINLEKTEGKLRKLLSDFRFSNIRAILEETL